MMDGRLCFQRCTYPMKVSGRLSVSVPYGLPILDGGLSWIMISDGDLMVFVTSLQEETWTIRGFSPVKEEMR